MLPFIVVDASVAGAWLFAETYSTQAQSVYEAIYQHRVVALCPDRFLEELLRICQKKTLPPPIGTSVSHNDAWERFLDVATSPITFLPSDELHERAWELVDVLHLTTHDALYVTMAEQWGAELWTIDIAMAHPTVANYIMVHDLRTEPFPY